MNKRQAILDEIPRLRRFAQALAGDRDIADDLVQDCLERALGGLHTWQENSNMRAWLFTILRNTYFNQLRASSRRPNETPLDEHHDSLNATPPAQAHGLIIRDLQFALKLLSDQHREVVLLVGLEGMNYKETAGILGVPKGTVMSRLSRARELLKQYMEHGENGNRPPLRRVK